jgi:hypothetical protein
MLFSISNSNLAQPMTVCLRAPFTIHTRDIAATVMLGARLPNAPVMDEKSKAGYF